MVDHEIVCHGPGYGPSPDLVVVNGHEPVIVHNVTLGRQTVRCRTCGWVGPTRHGRWFDKSFDDWRTHAGDLAVGVTLEHGRPGNSCRCAACAQATCAAVSSSTPSASTAGRGDRAGGERW